MKFGLTSSEWDFLERHLIEPLKQQGARVWIFGSRARGDQKPFSDIDVLYSLSPQQNLSPSFIYNLKEQLVESHLPYKVDLVFEGELAASYAPFILRDRVEV